MRWPWITERLRQSHATLGDVALNGHSNPLKAWEDLKDKDLDSLNWLGPVLTFDQPLLFPPEDDIHLNDRQYREVVLKKVECLCHRAALKILERVKCHLEDLQSSLTLMQTAENRVDNAAPAVFQEILSQLA